MAILDRVLAILLPLFDTFFDIQTLTPGSDLVPGGPNNQILLGRDGNDTLVAFNPAADEFESQKLDLFLVIQSLLPHRYYQ